MLKGFSNVGRVISVCKKKGLRYWCLAALFTFLGWYGSQLLESIDLWLDIKDRAYLAIQNMRGGQKRVPLTTLVAIDDDDYYGSELAGRKPLKRSYLAKLISHIAEAKPLVIALDVDFRSPVPDSDAADFADYAQEDHALAVAVCAARSKTKIVLSKAVSRQADGNLAADRNIYDETRECGIPNDDIAVGFLSLPIDLRRVPLSVRINANLVVDSFALAIARSVRPHQYPSSMDLANLPYGEFHDPSEFTKVGAADALSTRAKERLRGQVVIVYGAWHVLASHRGASVVDTFRTPIGLAGGAYVHANLVETLINASLKSSPPDGTAEVLELLIALWLTIAFAFHTSLSKKLGKIALTALALFVAAWFFFQVFALSFDILPLLAAMSLHAVVDQIWEWRELAQRPKADHDRVNQVTT